MSTTRDWVGEKRRSQEGMARSFQPSPASGASPQARAPLGIWSPPVDIYETEDRIFLRADLPGISIAQIEVKIENDRIILKGERSMAPPGLRGDFRRTERPHGKFLRTFVLPKSILQSEIRAVMENGVLEVVLPKHTGERSKPIKVEVR